MSRVRAPLRATVPLAIVVLLLAGVPPGTWAFGHVQTTERVLDEVLTTAAGTLYSSDNVQVYVAEQAGFAEAFPNLELYWVLDLARYPPVLHAMAWDPSATAVQRAYDVTRDFNQLLTISNAVVASPAAAMRYAKVLAEIGNIDLINHRHIVGPADSARLGVQIYSFSASESLGSWGVYADTWADEENGLVAGWRIQITASRLTGATWTVRALGAGDHGTSWEGPDLLPGIEVKNIYSGSLHALEVWKGQGPSRVQLKTPAQVLSASYSSAATATNVDGSTWRIRTADAAPSGLVDLAAAVARDLYRTQVARNDRGPACSTGNAEPNLGYESRDPDCALDLYITPSDGLLCGACILTGNETRIYLSPRIATYLADNLSATSNKSREYAVRLALARAHYAYLATENPTLLLSLEDPISNADAVTVGATIADLASVASRNLLLGDRLVADLPPGDVALVHQRTTSLAEPILLAANRGEPVEHLLTAGFVDLLDDLTNGAVSAGLDPYSELARSFNATDLVERTPLHVYAALLGALDPQPRYPPCPGPYVQSGPTDPLGLVEDSLWLSLLDAPGAGRALEDAIEGPQPRGGEDLQCAVVTLKRLLLGVPFIVLSLGLVGAGLALGLMVVLFFTGTDWEWDSDGDGLGNEWMGDFSDYKEQLTDTALDPDGDDLPTLLEFRWQTIPLGPFPTIPLFLNAHDHDLDNMTDREEYEYWNNEANDALLDPSVWSPAPGGPGFAPVDPDYRISHDTRYDDTGAAHDDGLTTTHDRDSDDDGIVDGDERWYGLGRLPRSYPELKDSDCPIGVHCPLPTRATDYANYVAGQGVGDNMTDGTELAYWNRISLDAWMRDYDRDGIASNLLDPDSDGDGLLDGDEFGCNCTRANRWDSDLDALLDGSNIVVNESDPRYDLFAKTILYEESTIGTRTFLGESAVGTEPTSWDTDGDGLPDGWEHAYNLTPLYFTASTNDTDQDAYPDLGEYTHAISSGYAGVWWSGTHPRDWDTDDDGLPDGWEDAFSLDPRSALDATSDVDKDDLGALAEYREGRPTSWDEEADGVHMNGTDPTRWDSDGDRLPDGYEKRFGLSPRDSLDSASDLDGDNLTTLVEYEYGLPPGWDHTQQGVHRNGLEPSEADTDGDELWDGDELSIGTDPKHYDSDRDWIPDGWEQRYGSFAAPRQWDRNRNDDADSFTADWCTGAGRAFTNYEEYLQSTHPGLADSDGDQIPDGYEVCAGTNPRQADPNADGDDDGLGIVQEFLQRTHPGKNDTDGDGLCDGGFAPRCTWNGTANRPGEISYESNPLVQDTDGDGWYDGEEAHYWDPTGSGVMPDDDGDGRNNLNDTDSDADGLGDRYELNIGTRPGAWDTDGDGLSDSQEVTGWEITWNGAPLYVTSDPLVPDTDGDDLWDGDEKTHGTSPRMQDTDEDGLRDGLEAEGWEVVVDGITRGLISSNPLLSDTDGDGLEDPIEQMLRTDPRNADTDADGLSDRGEDSDRDGVFEIAWAETSPTLSDTDGDGLNDGAEVARGTDPVVTDTDEDDLLDGEEVTLGTSPTNHDSDNDYLPDEEEIDRGLEPQNQDKDGDKLLDGEEVYFFETDPFVADQDCDGRKDGDDLDPYSSNLEPGRTLTAEEKAHCPPSSSAVGAGSAASFVPLPGGLFVTPNPTAAPLPPAPILALMGIESDPGNPDEDDVALTAINSEGSVTVFARSPEGYNGNDLTFEIALFFHGQARTNNGGVPEAVPATATVRAELQPMDDMDPNATVPWTHAVRVGLPDGMLSATRVTYSFSYMTPGLAFANYRGEFRFNGSLDALPYEEDILTPADEEEWDGGSTDTPNSTAWESGRRATSGVDSDADVKLQAGGIRIGGDTIWAFRIVRPPVPTLIGTLVNGTLAAAFPEPGSIPHGFAFYDDTAIPVQAEALPYYRSHAWWHKNVEAPKLLRTGLTKAASAVAPVTTTVTNLATAGGQAVSNFAYGVYDEIKSHPAEVEFAGRVVADVAGVGDMIDVYQGTRDGDYVMAGLGILGLVTSGVAIASGGTLAPLDVGVTGLKTTMRAKRLVDGVGTVSKASYTMQKGTTQVLVKYGDEAVAAGRAGDAAAVQVSVGQTATMNHLFSTSVRQGGDVSRGYTVLAGQADDLALMGGKSIPNGVTTVRIVGKVAGELGDDTAAATGKVLLRSTKVSAETSTRALTKMEILGASLAGVAVALVGLLQGEVGGMERHMERLGRAGTPQQQKGLQFELDVANMFLNGKQVGDHVYTTQDLSVTGQIEEQFTCEGRTYDRPKVEIDTILKREDGKAVLLENKNYTRPLSGTGGMIEQLCKLWFIKQTQAVQGKTVDELWLVVYNGEVTAPLKAIVKRLGFRLFDKEMIEVPLP